MEKIRKAKDEGGDFRKTFPEVYRLGYMTKPVGLIFDPATSDAIIIGEKSGNSNIFLDDFACSLKSLYLYGDYPKITIDPEGNINTATWHKVKMTKGIENSHFGQVFFESDYLLKKISLNLVKIKASRFKSQYRLIIEGRRQDNISSRFWFKPTPVDILVSNNAVFINSYPVRVLSETLYPKFTEDPTAVKFAQSFNQRFDELAKDYPIFEDLRSLLRLVGIAGSISSMDFSPDLNFWLTEYEVKKVQIPERVKALSNIYGDLDSVLRVCGGIDSAFLNLRLKAKDARAMSDLADLIINSRPCADALTWDFLLREFKFPISQQSGIAFSEMERLYSETLLLVSKKEYEKAIGNFSRIIEMEPDSSFAWHMKAGLLHDLERYREALACYDEVLKISPQDTAALVNKSDALLKLKRYREALQYAEVSLKINPKDADGWYNKAEALENLNRPKEAIKAYEMFLKFAPADDSDIQKAKEKIYWLKKIN